MVSPDTEPRFLNLVAIAMLLLSVYPVVPAIKGDALMDPAFPGEIRWGPFLTYPASDSITVNWRTEEICRGSVWFEEMRGHTAGSFRFRVGDETGSTMHHVRLGNLSPGTRYVYTLSPHSPEYTFRTFGENGSVRFVVYGDTRDQLPFYSQEARHGIVASQIAREDEIQFIINTGDLVQSGDLPEDWDRFFDAADPILPGIPYYPVTGNHEERSDLFTDIFEYPPNYTFTCSNVRVAVLDNTLRAPCTLGDQAGWLDQDLAGWTGWKFVAFHYPIYSSREGRAPVREDLQAVWEPVFEGNDITAVFTGHVHAFEHYTIRDVHHFTVGTGGAPPYPLSEERPQGYQASFEDTLGYIVVTVEPGRNQAVIQYKEVGKVENGEVLLYKSPLIRDAIVVPGPGPGSGLRSWWSIPEFTSLRLVLLQN